MAKRKGRTIPIILAAVVALAAGQVTQSAIHFSFQSIPFSLDSDETPERHAPETMAGGVAVFDYDNDGNLDIFFTNGADITSVKKTSPKYWNRLFHNDGKGNFTDVTEKAGLTGTGYDTGVAVGDFDNDGYEDLFVAGVYRNTLYHNNGDGTFADGTERAGLSHSDKEFGPLWSVGAAWVDVNNDGLLDLFVVNYLSWDAKREPKCMFAGKPEYCAPRFYQPLPNQLFLNIGGGKFEDVSVPSGIRKHRGKGMGVGVADYDGDGRPDILVANDKLFNSFFHNLGNGRFKEIGSDAGVALPENANLISGMGVDFKDLNNDGLPDIIIVALVNETFPVYQNTGKAAFVDITAASGMAALSRPMSGYSPNILGHDGGKWNADAAKHSDQRLVDERVARARPVIRKVVRRAGVGDQHHAFGDVEPHRHAVGADRGNVVDAHRGDLAVGVNGHARRDLMVAHMDVGQKRLQAIRQELHRPADHLADGRDRHLLGIDVDLESEAAADVRRDDTDLVLGNSELAAEHALHLMGRLVRMIDRQSLAAGIVVGDQTARLERKPGLPVKMERVLEHVGSRREMRHPGSPVLMLCS